MANKIKYYVIGGQYNAYCYGGCATLLGAKRIAGRHLEYWDNWQGWHAPKIYRAEDCEMRDDPYGRYSCMMPKAGTMACAFAWYDNGRLIWEAVPV